MSFNGGLAQQNAVRQSSLGGGGGAGPAGLAPQPRRGGSLGQRGPPVGLQRTGSQGGPVPQQQQPQYPPMGGVQMNGGPPTRILSPPLPPPGTYPQQQQQQQQQMHLNMGLQQQQGYQQSPVQGQGQGQGPVSGMEAAPRFDTSDFPALGGGDPIAPGPGQPVSKGVTSPSEAQVQASQAGFAMQSEDFPALGGGPGGGSSNAAAAAAGSSSSAGIGAGSGNKGRGAPGSALHNVGNNMLQQGGVPLQHMGGLSGQLAGPNGQQLQQQLQQQQLQQLQQQHRAQGQQGSQGPSAFRSSTGSSSSGSGSSSSASGSGAGAGSGAAVGSQSGLLRFDDDKSGSAERYGLMGLLGVIRMTDPDLNTLALGTDLTTLGLNLNSQDSLYSTFAYPCLESPARRDPDYVLPYCYYMQPPALKTSHLKKIQLETLFYIFYNMPKDTLQVYAAKELYHRSWFYHKTLKWWFLRADDQNEQNFTYFDINNWSQRLYTPQAGNIPLQQLQLGFASQEELFPPTHS